MKWTTENTDLLKSLAYTGASNKEIAKRLNIPITDVYAKRSQLGITIDKVKAAKAGTVNPEFEALFLKTEIEEKRELLHLLEPAMVKADPYIKSLELAPGGKEVYVIYTDETHRTASIECDSPLAIIADVTHKCLY